MERRITIVAIPFPRDVGLNVELQWLGNSLGLFNDRDKDKTCFRIFVSLIKGARQQRALSSDEIAEMLHLSRGTVIHHINKLMKSGIVVHDASMYRLRVEQLSALIQELQRDVNKFFEKLQHVAEEIDKQIE